jgi:hypothetical protein
VKDERSTGSAKKCTHRMSNTPHATDCSENLEQNKSHFPPEVNGSLSSCRLSDDSGLGGVTSLQNDEENALSAASAIRDHPVCEHSSTSRTGSTIRHNKNTDPITEPTETVIRPRSSSSDLAPVSVDDGPDPSASSMSPAAAATIPNGAPTSMEIKVSPLPTANAVNSKNTNHSNTTKTFENRKLPVKPHAEKTVDDKSVVFILVSQVYII